MTDTKRTKSHIPFVNLHNHTTFSIFDGLGFPEDHMRYAYENGCDALAISDHGNMSALVYQVEAHKKLLKEGKKIKPIFGIEAYFIESIPAWKDEYNRIQAEKKTKKKKEEATSGTVVENEDETRKNKSTLRRRAHLLLLAKNQTGLNNLFALVSKSYKGDNFYSFPRMDLEDLKQHSEGLIASSACLGGIYGDLYWKYHEQGEDILLDKMRNITRKLLDIFGDNWFGELQWNSIPEQHKLNNYVIQLSKEFGFKLISTVDAHYPNPSAWRSREVYKRLGWLGKAGKDKPGYLSDDLPKSVDEIGYELYPKNGDQVWESYKKYTKKCGVSYDDDLIKESITRTHNIAFDLMEDFLPNADVKLPAFVVPKGQDEDFYLAKLSIAGLKDKKLDKKKNYVERLKKELHIIKDRGFSRYFLTMKAIADKANELQITGCARGSAAGSLAAYVLDITQVDPIRFDLQFERFLRSDAVDYPDIDFDVSDPMVLKETMIKEWGENSVVPISNWNTLQLRSLIKDISKFYDVPFMEVNAVTSKMLYEATPIAKKKHGIAAGVYVPTFEEVCEYSQTLQRFFEKYPEIKSHVDEIHGQIRSCSRHAGGILVADDIHKKMPLISSGGVVQSPWTEGQTVRHLEPMGFIKFDVLGLASLRMFEGAIRHILRRHKKIENPTFQDVKQFYAENLHPELIDFDDQKVYENVFHKGKWAGIFQFTEQGAQRFCKRAKPTSLTDIAALTSIYRPGPLSAEVDKQYVSMKEDPSQIEYEHPILKELLGDTYGFLIFQEQLALVAHKLGKDISLDDGNLLRKVFTKKGTGKTKETTDRLYSKFLAGCEEKGISRIKADRLWKRMEFFSGYGFNKSHAISYSILSYQCAWLLTYFPSEWAAAFLDKEPETRKEKAINIVKSIGFSVKGIDINTSGNVWEISEDGKTIIQPLSSIKGLGDAAIEYILKYRPFHKIEDLILNENIPIAKVNKKCLDVLVKSRAMDKIVDERFNHARHFWLSVVSDRPKTEKKLLENIEINQLEEDFSDEEVVESIVSLTGIFPFDLVMSDKIKEALDNRCVPAISDYDKDLQVVWCIPRECVVKRTKKGKDYFIVKVLDDSCNLTIVRCWGIDKSKDFIHVNHPYMVKLNHNEQWGFSSYGMTKKNWKLLG